MVIFQQQSSMEECIRTLLDRWGLSAYTDLFLRNGYDDINIIRSINEDDLHTMGINCIKESRYILEKIVQLNQMFMTNYMSVEDVYSSSGPVIRDQVLQYVSEKLERDGLLPSGEDVFLLVQDKLNSEGIHLSPFSSNSYINNDGREATRREYNMLRARYAQELFLPTQTVTEALSLLHKSLAYEMESSSGSMPPAKPPKPKGCFYDQRTGRWIWLNPEPGKYENVNCLYEMINRGDFDPSSPPSLPHRNQHPSNLNQNLAAQSPHDLRRYEEVLKFDCTQSQNSSPIPVRHTKKKHTFFKRFKHNLFGKPNSSLDSYLASSQKTLISDRSSECSNSKIGFFSKKKAPKEKTPFERQRSNSAPEAARNVSLHQIPETTANNPAYGRPLPSHRASCSSHTPDRCVCGPQDTYAHVFPSRELRDATPLFPGGPPSVTHKSDTFSSTSLSSGSLSGDSAYSSKPCLNAIKSSHRPVIYGPLLPPNVGHFPVPNPLVRQSSLEHTRCKCCCNRG